VSTATEAVAVVVTIGFLLVLGLVLFIVDRRRPAFFRLKATLTKWVSLDLEMHSPEGGPKPIGGHGDETQD
jgi:hypothetical protein